MRLGRLLSLVRSTHLRAELGDDLPGKLVDLLVGHLGEVLRHRVEADKLARGSLRRGFFLALPFGFAAAHDVLRVGSARNEMWQAAGHLRSGPRMRCLSPLVDQDRAWFAMRAAARPAPHRQKRRVHDGVSEREPHARDTGSGEAVGLAHARRLVYRPLGFGK